MGLKGNCVQEYESGLTCCEGGSELGLRQSRESVRFDMWKPTKVRTRSVGGGKLRKVMITKGTGAVGETRRPPYGDDICLPGASWLTQGDHHDNDT
jgi:hypothetical protein